MTDLSPAAQAVLDAFLNGYICSPECNVAFESDRNGLAAALRAVANEVAPFEAEDINGCWYEKRNPVREQLLAIAAELDANAQ